MAAPKQCENKTLHDSHSWKVVLSGPTRSATTTNHYMCMGLLGWAAPEYCQQFTPHDHHRFLSNDKNANDYQHCSGISEKPCGGLDVHPEHAHSYLGEGGYSYLSYCPGSLVERFCTDRKSHKPHIFDKGAYRCMGIKDGLPTRCGRIVAHNPHNFKWQVIDAEELKAWYFDLSCDGSVEKEEEFTNYNCGLKALHGPHIAEQPMMGKKLRCFGNLFDGLVSPNTARKAAGLPEAKVEDVIAGVIRNEVDRQIRERIRLENLEAIRRFSMPLFKDSDLPWHGGYGG